jgi:hypothetical protein
MESKLFSRGFVALALTVGLIAQANAIPQLKLESSSGPSILVTDNAAGDINAADGAITYLSTTIPGWNMSVTTGLSLPVIGSALEPEIDLVSVDVSSAAGGTLSLWFTDTGFGPASNAAHVLSAIGGTTQGSVTFRSFYDTTNTAFGMQHELSNQSFSPVSFSGEQAGELQSATPYSLTLLVTIVHAGSGSTSFDAMIKVPEPSSLLLLGAGLLAAGLVVRRRATAVVAA